MHTLRIFSFRLLDPPEWACRRVSNVEETHLETSKTFFLNGMCIFEHGNFGLSLAHARAYGKPPPESKLRIEQAKCFQSVAKKDAKGLRTLLIADGAPCYPALAKKYGLLLQQCNHSQGNFCRTITLKNRGKVKIHTGHVDGFWKLLKEAIPGSLPSKRGHARNPQIWKRMRSFQWRWECTDKNLMQTTADTLKKI